MTTPATRTRTITVEITYSTTQYPTPDHVLAWLDPNDPSIIIIYDAWEEAHAEDAKRHPIS